MAVLRLHTAHAISRRNLISLFRQPTFLTTRYLHYSVTCRHISLALACTFPIPQLLVPTRKGSSTHPSGAYSATVPPVQASNESSHSTAAHSPRCCPDLSRTLAYFSLHIQHISADMMFGLISNSGNSPYSLSSTFWLGQLQPVTPASTVRYSSLAQFLRRFV